LTLLTLITLASTVLAGLEDAKYSTVLSAANFDSKIKEPEVGTLVAFFAPWCGHCKSLEPTWTKVGKAFETESKCKIGHLDADKAENKVVSSRYGVSGFPTIKFLPSSGPAIDYSGARTESAFLSFLNEQCGTHRISGGLLSEQAGRLPDLDELAAQYLPASVSERGPILEQARSLAEKLGGAYTKIYLRIFDKVTEDGSYLAKEGERVKKLLEKRATLANAKIDELQIKQNILKAFQAVKEKAGEVKDQAEAIVNQAKAKVEL